MDIPRLEARRILRALAASGQPVSANRLYDLVLTATEDRKAAEAAWKQHRHAELRAGIVPED